MRVSVILAAGEGSRMKSNKPKVLHEILGMPMIDYVIEATKNSNVEKTDVVVGHGEDKIREYFGDRDITFKSQPIGEGCPYGTGFAVMQTLDSFHDNDTVLILNGDTPLIRSDTIDELIKFHEVNNFSATILTAVLDCPYGYGRIIRDDKARIKKIVEEKDACQKEKLVREINSGIFVFKGKDLKESLKTLNTDNTQGELYLTDAIESLSREGKEIGGFKLKDNREIVGVNSRDNLALCTQIMRERINNDYLINGVTMIDSKSVIIEPRVKIGRDTVIYPGAVIQGTSVIGEGCTLYGTTRIVDSIIGDNVSIDNSLIENSQVGSGSKLGPYAHIRPNSKIGKNTKIGNFVEIKNSNFGDGSKAAHLAYVGDADIGKNVNIGCGVVFVNYDGKSKHRSTVGDHAFVGSNANIVAPVKIEDYGYIAAGSTITKDVGEGQLSLERAKQVNIDGWVERKGLKK
ncbi:bifunctional UDP-N-acetylglucosamine diphosphorylase/glucosamine-1-phosphate N-acetyltransferase GlmU [Peptoniphilus catoniae]|uniref:bifunctional UDP-N-acetylglucosamine diphosphorylase/glucosamine-1-phosphate N-acetyltransferase GlmU n=1 Tax=Peptoniphilus catoniae TaxID=1660341 RepID=UPI0010FE9058|nr:bifunctional UDP-N-acetylglucosamine diphosphorylase/glucosamine-1-phosphate N-acetyltransferase GlmU [Peptoniphilus catoniae]